jgi:hypothetical protein
MLHRGHGRRIKENQHLPERILLFSRRRQAGEGPDVDAQLEAR